MWLWNKCRYFFYDFVIFAYYTCELLSKVPGWNKNFNVNIRIYFLAHESHAIFCETNYVPQIVKSKKKSGISFNYINLII